jgi:hypothetical protein
MRGRLNVSLRLRPAMTQHALDDEERETQEPDEVAQINVLSLSGEPDCWRLRAFSGRRLTRVRASKIVSRFHRNPAGRENCSQCRRQSAAPWKRIPIRMEATEEAPMSPGTFPLHGQHGNAEAI